MHLDQWLRFVRKEQLAPATFTSSRTTSSAGQMDDKQAAEADARRRFESSLAENGSQGISPLQFALQLLDAHNAAEAPHAAQDLDQRLADYWTSCSHNSYLVGDQLTGISSASIYRRQLLQERWPTLTHRHRTKPHSALCNTASLCLSQSYFRPLTIGLPTLRD